MSTSDISFTPKPTYIHNSEISVKFERSSLKQDKLSFTHGNVVKIFIVYELDVWSRDLNTDFTLNDCLFGVVKLVKNADPDQCFYSGYNIGFDSRSLFIISNFDFGKNVILLFKSVLQFC